MTTSPLVPAVLPFAIDGHAFLIDPDYERTTVQVLRQQADQSTEPGEASLNPAGLWRRSQESWHHGAGQDFLDGKSEQAADPHRFRFSKGVDVWTKGQVSLLHRTIKAWSTTNTNLHLAVTLFTGGNPFVLYIADGNEMYWSTMPFGGLNTLAAQIGTGWTATNATISTNANGTSFNLTATAAAVISATSPTGTSGIPVVPNREYRAFFYSQYTSGGAARIPRVSVAWYTAAGALISTTSPVAALNNDGGGAGSMAATTIQAPATAAFAAVIGDYSAASAIGEIHWIRSANLVPVDTGGTQASSAGWSAAGIQAGQAAQPVQSVATDGYHVWAALGTSGLHRTTAMLPTSTADVPAAPGAGQIHLVGYANGFLLAAGSTTSTTGKNTLWRVDSPLTAPVLSVIKTHDNPNFEWTGIGHGRSCVYAFGNSGGNGEIYKITFDANTGTLSTAASPATYLPDGETIHALQFYAGGIIMGTGKGVRLGQADGAGNIDYGPLVETEWPVRCLEPQGRWCWFGWTKYDAFDSLLGRIDLGYFTDTLTPAWASDLQTPEDVQGDVVSCVTFTPYGYAAAQRPPVRVFTVAGSGVYVEDPGMRQGTGFLFTGTIRYGTSEPKDPRSFDVRHHKLPTGADISVQMYRDGDTSTGTILGFSTVTDSFGPAAPFEINTPSAEAFEFFFHLTRPDPDGTDFTRSPELTRWTAKVLPTPSTIDETFTVKIHMKSTVTTTAGDGQDHPIDVPAEITYLKALERSRAVVEMQIADETHDVYVVGSRFVGDHWHSPQREFAEGMLELICQTVRG